MIGINAEAWCAAALRQMNRLYPAQARAPERAGNIIKNAAQRHVDFELPVDFASLSEAEIEDRFIAPAVSALIADLKGMRFGILEMPPDVEGAVKSDDHASIRFLARITPVPEVDAEGRIMSYTEATMGRLDVLMVQS